ncbi:MAG TPA: MBL fold metallo-hydrolase [Lachnospiraceae bacterium]|jgi:hydroxyacylglutathione hydrolase|nr:MBL fold metallo-hydrolase [Lachnospiraceae bacterium]
MADLKVGRMVLGPVSTNCYFIYRNEDKKAIVVDPAAGGKQIYQKLKDNGIEVVAIFLTHGHFDHIMGVNELKEASGVKVYACDEEQEVCEDVHNNCSDQIGRPYTVKADYYLHDGESIEIAGMKCKLLHTPGHTKGSCCFYFEDDKVLMSGDTLFLGSVGRTDLPTGSMGTLSRSIKEKLAGLPQDVKVYPGHDDQTTIEYESKYNPYWG